MTIELVRRVLVGGLVRRDVVELALLESLRSRRPVLEVVAAGWPELAVLVDRDLERLGVGDAGDSAVDPVLLSRCPPGLAETLGVLPLGQDPTTGEVLAAAADPLDRHASEELAHHLGTAVLLLRAPMPTAAAAAGPATPPAIPAPYPREVDPEAEELEALRPPRIPGIDPGPAPPLQGRAGDRGSDIPIPLVRQSFAPRPRGPRATEAVADAAMTPRKPDAGAKSTTSRPKASARAAGLGAHGGGAAVGPGKLEQSLAAIERSRNPDDVVSALLLGVEALAAGAVIFAEQGLEHRGRAASSWVADAEGIRAVSIPVGSGTVLDRAAAAGTFAGSVPNDRAHRLLRGLLGASARDVNVVPVPVRGRAAVTLVAVGLDRSVDDGRALATLATAASRALERILRSRKGG